MVNQELIELIKSEEVQGYASQQLYNFLIQQGYNPNEVNEAIKIASQTSQQVNLLSKLMKKLFNFLLILIIGVVVIGLIGGGIFFFTFQNNNVNSDTEINSGDLLTDKETEKDSEQLVEEIQNIEPLGSELIACDAFPDKLDSCEVFSCEFEHLFTGEMMEKKIIGLVNDKCKYTEEMPNNGRMDCEYTESLRKAVAQYHRDFIASESVGISIKADLESGDVEATYNIDGKEVENPLQEAMSNGQCVISGYENLTQDNRCPPGTKYKGESYTYENGEKIVYPICSDLDVACPPCENCVSGIAKKVLSGAEEVCFECLSGRDCKEGFQCFDHSCLNNNVLINNPSCEGFKGYVSDDPCQEYSCEICEKGHMVCQGGWSSWPSEIRYRCIECDDSFKKCVEGYKCEEYKCVVE